MENYWCAQTPNVPRFWSASSLATIGDCPRRFELAYVEGWKPTGPKSAFLVFGEIYHRLMAQYDERVRLKKMPPEEAQRIGIREAIAESQKFELDSLGENSRTTKTLIRAFLFHCDKYSNDTSEILQIQNQGAIELYFRFAIPHLTSADGESYILHGYIDEIRRIGKSVIPWERKTTGKSLSDWYWMQFDTNIQVDIYTIGAQVLTGEEAESLCVEALQSLVGETRLDRKLFIRTADMLEEAFADIRAHIKSAEIYAQNNYWPKNTSSCYNCDFKEVCAQSPSVRYNYLKTGFKQDRRTSVVEGRKGPDQSAHTTQPHQPESSQTP